MKGILFALTVLFFIGLTHAQPGYWYRAKEGDPCHHYSSPCQEKTLVSEQVTPCTSTDRCNG